MNTNQFTQKTIQAIQRAQQIAVEYGHQQVDQEHVMLALTEDGASLIPQLLEKSGLSADHLRAAVTEALGRIARVSGPGREADKVYISADLEKALLEAEARAKQMKDEYLSVEHVWMGLCDKPNARVKDMLKRLGYDEKAFLKALSDVRGATRVTTDSPEETYDALKKYGSDLVELARQNKLDPVAGTAKSATSSAFSPARPRITRCSSANPAWARRPSLKVWPNALWPGMCPILCAIARFFPWIWAA